MMAEKRILISFRPGEVRDDLIARTDDGIPRNSVFIAFCYYEAAANLLTNPALDPFAKIAEVHAVLHTFPAPNPPVPAGSHQDMSSAPVAASAGCTRYVNR